MSQCTAGTSSSETFSRRRSIIGLDSSFPARLDLLRGTPSVRALFEGRLEE